MHNEAANSASDAIPSSTDRWLWVAKGAACLAILLLLASFFIRDPKDFTVGEWLAMVAVAVTPYALILQKLIPQATKKGLALALVWGSMVFLQSALVSAVLLITAEQHGHWLFTGGYTLFALIHAALVAGARKSYYRMGKGPDDKRAWVWGFAIAAFVFVILIALGAFVLSS